MLMTCTEILDGTNYPPAIVSKATTPAVTITLVTCVQRPGRRETVNSSGYCGPLVDVALKKHRSAGEQTIKVEHVTVNEGDQAIVGIVKPQGGGGAAKVENQPHEPCATDERSSPLLGHIEADGRAMPSPVGARLEGVPVSRSTGRRANGTN
jgi:hypothetical protein